MNLYGHVRTYDRRKTTSESFGMVSSWKKKKKKKKNNRKTQNSWMQKVTTGMEEIGISSMELIGKEEWRRKI